MHAVRGGLLLPVLRLPPLLRVPHGHVRGRCECLLLHRLRRGLLRRGARGDKRSTVPSLRCGDFQWRARAAHRRVSFMPGGEGQRGPRRVLWRRLRRLRRGELLPPRRRCLQPMRCGQLRRARQRRLRGVPRWLLGGGRGGRRHPRRGMCAMPAWLLCPRAQQPSLHPVRARDLCRRPRRSSVCCVPRGLLQQPPGRLVRRELHSVPRGPLQPRCGPNVCLLPALPAGHRGERGGSERGGALRGVRGGLVRRGRLARVRAFARGLL